MFFHLKLFIYECLYDIILNKPITNICYLYEKQISNIQTENTHTGLHIQICILLEVQ